MKYLSQAERQHLFIAMMGNLNIKDWLNNTKSDYMSKDVRRRLKTAATHTERAVGEYIKQVPDEQAAKLLKDADNYRLAMERKSSLNKDVREVELDDLYFMASQVLYLHCKTCDKSKKQSKHCELKEALLNMAIPVMEEDTKDCPYKGDYGSVV